MSVFKDDQTTYTGNVTILGSLNVGGQSRLLTRIDNGGWHSIRCSNTNHQFAWC